MENSWVFPGRHTGRSLSEGCPRQTSPSLVFKRGPQGSTNILPRSVMGSRAGTWPPASRAGCSELSGADEKQQCSLVRWKTSYDTFCSHICKDQPGICPSNPITAFQPSEAAVRVISFLRCCLSDGIILSMAAQVSLVSRAPEWAHE